MAGWCGRISTGFIGWCRHVRLSSPIFPNLEGRLSESDEQGNTAFRFVPEYAKCIADVVNNWAWVELEIHTILFKLADLHPGIGACLTAQIYTFPAKMAAVVALLRYRQAPERLIKTANKFSGDSRAALEIRNRFAHDVWLNDNQDPSMMGKLVITAAKTLRYEIESVTLDQAQVDLKKVEKARRAATDLKVQILKILSSLPEPSRLGQHPTT